ncbi:SdpI family protein [Massilia sp. H6]|uniref:SdpI family protein n=1 Tax=Massilia sp. H6 TaxID=2970464 RepID=UPI00216A9A0A|nr:SdpI family protein [Massilia sp. H6]UVW27525.1 SdpI family protein [Massilia sp. H6]
MNKPGTKPLWKSFLLLFLAVTLLTLNLVLTLYPELPSLIPVHWNADGQADRWAPRATVLLHMAFMVVVGVLWLVLPKLSPKRFAVDQFESTWWYLGMVSLSCLAYVQFVHLWGAWKPGFDVDRALLGGMGMFFIFSGNVTGKVRRNFWLGVRTPWTLSNERVWYATHRFAAKTMVTGGMLALVVALADWPSALAVAALAGGALAPVAYSLVYYKRLERAGTLEA